MPHGTSFRNLAGDDNKKPKIGGDDFKALQPEGRSVSFTI